MAEQQISNQDMLDILLPELRNVNRMSQANSVALAAMAQQLSQLTNNTARLDKAIYGNGIPGLKALVDDHQRRLSNVEATCKLEQDAEIVDRVEAIEAKHKDEDDRRKAELAEWRKVKWGLFGTSSTVLLDILMHLLKIK